MFRDNPAVIDFGAAALRFQFMTFPLHGFIVMSTMMEQAIGKTVSATFLSVARQGFFFIPAVLILPLVLQETGVQMAQSVADVLTILLAVPIIRSVKKKIAQAEQEMQRV